MSWPKPHQAHLLLLWTLYLEYQSSELSVVWESNVTAWCKALVNTSLSTSISLTTFIQGVLLNWNTHIIYLALMKTKKYLLKWLKDLNLTMEMRSLISRRETSQTLKYSQVLRKMGMRAIKQRTKQRGHRRLRQNLAWRCSLRMMKIKIRKWENESIWDN